MPGAPALLSNGPVSRLCCISLLPSELRQTQGSHEQAVCPQTLPNATYSLAITWFCILLSGAPMMLGILLPLAFTHTLVPLLQTLSPQLATCLATSLSGLSFRACLLGWIPGTQFTLLVIPIVRQEPPASCLLH